MPPSTPTQISTQVDVSSGFLSSSTTVVIFLSALIIIIFFIASYIFRKRINAFNQKNSSTESFTSFADLQKKGLISEEEYKNIRKRLVEKTLAEREKEPITLEKLSIELIKQDISQSEKIEPPKEKPPLNAIGIDDLLSKGLITEEEYQKLKKIDH